MLKLLLLLASLNAFANNPSACNQLDLKLIQVADKVFDAIENEQIVYTCNGIDEMLRTIQSKESRDCADIQDAQIKLEFTMMKHKYCNHKG